jgi:DNA/RNA-binding domain of Phe-tRNA-synthetase-like protein
VGISPLVDANFIAEVETLVLTVGHDVARLQEPIVIDIARAGDHITQMHRAAKAGRAGDMIMRDAQGVSCSIIYGQDNRSPIASETSRVLYVAYAPIGVPAATVDTQLQQLTEHIRLFSPSAIVEQHWLLSA